MKAPKILVTELQGLETLFKVTPKSSRDRPMLMRRLADGYVELESVAFRDKTEASMKADEAKANGSGSAQNFEDNAGKADKILGLARQHAIMYYTDLNSQYPGWCQTIAADPIQSTGCGDEVLYYLAYEYEQINALDDANKAYLELIQNWPQSKFISKAYLVFGDIFFNAALSNPSKWALAEQAYIEVTKYPPPWNKAWGYAHYKLGYVYWNEDDFVRALSEFKKTIEYGTQYASLPTAERLAVSARRNSLAVYVLVGDPKRAYDFFAPLSGGGTQLITMLDALAGQYREVAELVFAVEVYLGVIDHETGPQVCVVVAHLDASIKEWRGSADQAERAKQALGYSTRLKTARHTCGTP